MEPWQVPIEDIFNHIVMPLNRSNQMVVYQSRVQNNINWTVYDIDKRIVVKHEIHKPQIDAEYSLRHVAELMPGKYLLTTDGPNPNSYFVYHEDKSKEALRLLKTELGDKIYEVISVGPWLYAFEYNVSPTG
jgi:hypothetical protein